MDAANSAESRAASAMVTWFPPGSLMPERYRTATVTGEIPQIGVHENPEPVLGDLSRRR
jgi:hypothetical protein